MSDVLLDYSPEFNSGCRRRGDVPWKANWRCRTTSGIGVVGSTPLERLHDVLSCSVLVPGTITQVQVHIVFAAVGEFDQLCRTGRFQ